jgi:2-polyprenyl-6-methoxyphenol hydroxylase-like FAD-dependent oxidoreductase
MARIIVIGGSLGGLMAAHMLLRAGHDVQVLERAASSLAGRGAGIVTHQPLMAALERCGLTVDASLGVAVTERVVLAKDGAVVERAHISQVLTSWSRLYAMLSSVWDAQRMIFGASVASVVQNTSSVRVQCEDGRSFEADLVIAADGIRSTVRAQLAPQVQPQYAGYVAWRGVCEEAVLSQLTLKTVFDTFGFGVPTGEQLIGYPVAGAGDTTARGQRRYNFVWYRPASEPALKDLMTDADGQHYPLGISPNKVAWQHVAAVRQVAREKLAPQFAEMLEKTAQPFLQPIYDCASSQVAFDRVALLGDAAFVARPHVGMGVTKAAEDASALADCIAAHGASPQALQAYEAQRMAACMAVVQRGRMLGAYMQALGQAAGNGAVQASQRDARSVMLETAVDLSERPSRISQPATASALGH